MVHITSLAWMMSLMLAPHSLTLVGNLTGVHQGMFFIWLVPALGLYWLTARSAAAINPSGTLKPVLVTLSLAGRWVTTLMLSPLLLVTAGFAFNEIFVFWFPNFAFAFILLGLLLAIHLVGGTAVRTTQLFLLALVVGGLGTLIVMGLWQNAGWSAIGVSEPPAATSFSPYAVIMLFVGFDLALNQAPAGRTRQFQGIVNRGLLAAAVVMALWALVSLVNVPTDKLSDSFIPYLLAARNIGGDTGRMIMGVVVIAGSCAAVNALFVSVSQSNAQLVAKMPSHRLKWLNFLKRPAFWLILSAIIVATLMAGGMAGTEEIDIYLRAGLIFWLAYYGAVHLAAFFDSFNKVEQIFDSRIGWWGPAFGAIGMMFGVGMLLLTDPDRTQLLKFAWIVLTISALAVWSGRVMYRILIRETNGAAH